MLDDENSNGTPEPIRSGRDVAPCRECGQLQRKVAELEAENTVLNRELSKRLSVHIEIDKEKMLEEFDREPSFAELIDEIEKGNG